MTPQQKYKNKKIAVYGMGKTGQSAVNAFKKLKARVYCWDDNTNLRKKIKKFNYELSKFWLNKSPVDYIVVSPGIDIKKNKLKKYFKKNKKKIITDLDLFFELNKNIEIISITGTNGKSTTCKLVEKILKTAKFKVKTLGNIGEPILLSNIKNKKCIIILEVSSYQLEYSKIFRSRHAAILNISPDHLERHKNITNYIKAKSRIFLAQKKLDNTYINFNNKHSNFIKKIFKSNNIKSKLNIINKFSYKFLLKKIKNKNFDSTSNLENLSFAYKIAKNLNISDETIVKAINGFKGLPHRQEIIMSNKQLLCINDSKATSFEASLQSLINYNKIYWIVGGLPKFRDYFSLKKVRKNIIKAYVIGNSATFFVNQIKKHIKYKVSKNIHNAINDISKDLNNNHNIKNTILFSPAAASFDQYVNFELRGVDFKKLINRKFKQKLNV